MLIEMCDENSRVVWNGIMGSMRGPVILLVYDPDSLSSELLGTKRNQVS